MNGNLLTHDTAVKIQRADFKHLKLDISTNWVSNRIFKTICLNEMESCIETVKVLASSFFFPPMKDFQVSVGIHAAWFVITEFIVPAVS